ncbi:putative ribonuclease H-like domain-containing protein [Tanacetum coccineum]
MGRTRLNQKVKTIRCDNGTEFKNKDVIELCGSKGIKREYSNARTPQQNGVAERKNRTLLFDDADGIDSLPNQAIFDAIQLMGYEGDLTVLTFNKALLLKRCCCVAEKTKLLLKKDRV